MKKITLLFLIIVVFFLNTKVFAHTEYKTEIIDFRTKYHKVFDLGDGQNEMVFYQSPVHFWNGIGYQEINNQLFYENTEYYTKESNYNISFPKYWTNATNEFKLSYLSLYDLNIKFEYKSNKSVAIPGLNKFKIESTQVDVDFISKKNHFNIISDTNDKLSTYIHNSMGFQFEYNQLKNTVESISIIIQSETLNHKINARGIQFVDDYGNEIYNLNLFSDLPRNGQYKIEYLENINSLEINVSKFQMGINSNDNLAFKGEFEYSMNTSYPHIKDKYVIKGNTGSFDDNTLFAGTDPVGIVIDNQVYRDEYITFFELSLPNLTPYAVTSASLYVNKTTSSPIYIHNPNLVLSQVVDENYDNLNGLSNYDEVYIGNGNGSETEYTFDITQSTKEQLEIDNVLLLSLKGQPLSGRDSGKASIYSVNANHNQSPVFSVTYDTNYEQNPYGNANAYQYTDNQDVNCFGYALNLEEWIELNDNYGNGFWDDDIFRNVFIFVLENKFLSKGFLGRYLFSRLDGVTSFERRIAFRIRINQQGGMNDIHFMMEHNDGTWSHKQGFTPSILLQIGDNPDMNHVWSSYNSTTLYFSIMEWGH